MSDNYNIQVERVPWYTRRSHNLSWEHKGAKRTLKSETEHRELAMKNNDDLDDWNGVG